MHLSSNTLSSTIQLQSPNGQALWSNCIVKNQGMVDYFVPNSNTLLSGPVSLALLLNAINVVYRLKYSDLETKEERDAFLDKLYNTDERFLISIEELISLGRVSEFFDTINVTESGMTLVNLNSVAVKLGFGTVLNYAKNESMTTEQQKAFQNVMTGDGDRYVLENSEALESFVSRKIGSAAPSGIIANYNPTIFGSNNRDESSWFGAIAAYHDGKVLIIDGGGEEAVWVNAQDLYKAMSQVDPKSGVPMGMISIYELL